MNTTLDITSAVNHYFSDNVYIKQMECPAGYTVDTHKHKYDHLSILSKGTALVTIDDKPTMYTAPACINIEKNKTHTIVALEDIVWFCIHSTEERDMSKIDKVLIRENT
jgi:quercetin dioxygenase-like cupin family protein